MVFQQKIETPINLNYLFFIAVSNLIISAKPSISIPPTKPDPQQIKATPIENLYPIASPNTIPKNNPRIKINTAITEKIVVEQVTIPYETITKEATGSGDETRNKVVQNGQDGLKEITYKIKYQNETEIEKTVLSEKEASEYVERYW